MWLTLCEAAAKVREKFSFLKESELIIKGAYVRAKQGPQVWTPAAEPFSGITSEPFMVMKKVAIGIFTFWIYRQGIHHRCNMFGDFVK